MGMWAVGPLGNDRVADWFFGLKDTGIYKMIEAGLSESSYEIVRGAAYLLVQLGDGWVYDPELLEKHKKIALERLNEILENKEWTNEKLLDSVREQINKVEQL